jgi:general secretion pathway protein F/type IV pilus assembly protein PilC
MGKKITGVLEADSSAKAKEQLKGQPLTLIKITEEHRRATKISMNPVMKLSFLRELTQLLQAGLPLFDCLSIIAEKSRKEKYYPMLADFLDRLKQGVSLSGIMRNYPHVFHAIDEAIVSAAEKTGTLSTALAQLVDHLERGARFKKRLVGIIAYPLFLLGFACILFCALLFFLIPSMQELYEGRELQPLTSIILAMSAFCRDHLITLLVAFLSPFLIGYLVLQNTHCKSVLFKSLLKLPLLGKLFFQVVMSQFGKTVALLLQSGLPLLEALKLSRPTLKFPDLTQALAEIEVKILEGKSFAEELTTKQQFPLTVSRIIALAEETGRVKEAFESIAKIYDEELDKSLEKLTTLLQPALLLLLGIIVGVMMLAVLLPLIDVNSFLST